MSVIGHRRQLVAGGARRRADGRRRRPAAPAAPTMMQVNVPQRGGGQPIAVQANGQMMQVTVPDGLKPATPSRCRCPHPSRPSPPSPSSSSIPMAAATVAPSSVPMAAATVAPSSVPFAASSVAPMGTAALDAQTRALGVSPSRRCRADVARRRRRWWRRRARRALPARCARARARREAAGQRGAPPTHTHTGSPHITTSSTRRPRRSASCRGRLGRACVVAGAIDASDPFGPHLKGGGGRGCSTSTSPAVRPSSRRT